MELSIIIVSYNVRELLQECIRSVFLHIEKITFEIIVVDNCSSDESAAIIEKKFPSVKLIRNNFNVGFSEANNQGIKNANGNYILLLNPDTLLFDSSILTMLLFAKERNKDLIIAPKLLNADRSLQHSAWHDKNLLILLQETFRIFKSAYPLEKYTSPHEVENVAGAVMLFPKTLIARIGNFDPDLFWMEDFDLCYRARNSGAEVLYFPDASIIHYGGKSSAQNPAVMYTNDNISKLKFYKKHKTKLQTIMAGSLILFHLFVYSFFLLLLSPFSKNYRDKFLPYCRSTSKFLKYLLGFKIPLT